jgi:large subunit ribosomal protein L23
MRADTSVVLAVRQSEKGVRLQAQDQYILDVAPDANKIEIREAVERLFNVQVERVNTMACRGKWRRLQARWGRRPDWKKAVVTLKKGQKIEVKG